MKMYYKKVHLVLIICEGWSTFSITVQVLDEPKFSINQNFQFGYGLNFSSTEKSVDRFLINQNSG